MYYCICVEFELVWRRGPGRVEPQLRLWFVYTGNCCSAALSFATLKPNQQNKMGVVSPGGDGGPCPSKIRQRKAQGPKHDGRSWAECLIFAIQFSDFHMMGAINIIINLIVLLLLPTPPTLAPSNRDTPTNTTYQARWRIARGALR